MDIHIDWDGPYDLDSIKKLSGASDYGIYQVYGTHPIYGSNVLLYIGQANKQEFSVRLSQHDKFIYNQDSESITIYVGRLGGNSSISNKDWEHQINIAEKLLIYSHKPALNSSNINSASENIIPIEAHIYNWQNHKNLLPEVSAFRYLADEEPYFRDYKTYGDDEI